jgi:histidyl-tRNA synthetase
MKFQAVKGTRDILPPESALWNRVERVAREVSATFGFHEIRLPVFEETELFARSVGTSTDIVGKEMYTFSDGEESSISLRPEATASVVRAYIEHGMQTLPGDVKLYYMGPMFRRERPQKGRYRQFYQIGAEVLGQSDHPGIDADVIEMVLVFIERCGLVGHTLYINSIGCRECRPKYVELLRAELANVKDKLGPDSQRRIETNPLRVLDSKLESEQAVIEALPRIGDHLCEACREHFKMLQAMLFMRQIAYEVNWRLVRGLDYYMRTTFEITAPGLGSQNAVCGGGRYDGLVELLGGPPTKGIGFALGTDRLILALQEAGKGETASSSRDGGAGLDAYVAWMGASTYAVAVRVARALRDAGFSVEMPHEEMKFKKSLGLAGRLGARFAVILGDNEVAAGTCTVKRMADGTQATIAERELAGHLRG